MCCGRLDKDSEGYIILTGSGALAAKLMHPSGNVEKFYVVTVDKPISRCHCKRLRDGVDEGGEFLGVHSLSAIPGSSRSLAITLHCGKKRHIRRMLAAFDYEVKRLVRHRIGNFSLGSLWPQGNASA
ncbi:MAG: hypothetical protein LBI39_01990 [Puniceicoccales bacterium]|nr:hypothetical protein [Puniceicoccales bacterium]